MRKNFKFRIYTLLVIVLFSFLISRCTKVEDDPLPIDETPVLTTAAISLITQTTAVSGGNITSDAGAAITLRGVCWGIAKTPTIDDFKTNDGTGTGTFISNITGLRANTTYYVRAYAINSKGTGYGTALQFKTPDLIIGSTYQGGKLAYVLQVGDPGYIEGQSHGIIVSPTDLSIEAEWGCLGTAITGADAEGLGMGNQNTIDIVSGCTTAGIAAKLCSDLVLGVYSDWYLPSKDELNVLYLNRTAIGSLALKDYWSSSEWLGNYSWYQNLGDGKQEYAYKNYKGYVRAIRAF